MKIKLLTRHYWPDSTPGARLHRAILEHLASQGHQVSVLTSQPSYNDMQHERTARVETKNGVEIQRVTLLPERKSMFVLRALNAVYFQLRAFWVALRSDADLLIVSSYPPVIPGLCATVVNRWKGTPFLYHCLDIQPESASLVGKLRNEKLVNWLKRIDRKTCQRAAAVVTLSKEMAETLKSRGYDGQTIRLINNFHTEPYAGGGPADADTNRDILPMEDRRVFQIVFAGNMGSFQGLDLLIDAAWKLRDHKDIHFVLMGAGERKASLVRHAGALNGQTIHFIPFQPVEVASTVVRGSDLAVVSLLPEVFATAVPSKTMMYLRAGCPILAMIEPNCALANLIRDRDLGVVPEHRDAQAVADAILQVAKFRPRVTDSDRKRLIDTGESLFGYDRTLEKWTLLINRLDADTPSRVSVKEPRRAA